MFENIEIRKYSYSNKAAIMHIDRRDHFKKRMFEKIALQRTFQPDKPLNEFQKIIRRIQSKLRIDQSV